jgi:hypothetical protein
MTLIRNVSPRGALDVPLLDRSVDAGEVVEVSAEHAAILLQQVDNWHPGDPGVLKGAALAAALVDAGLPATGTADDKRAALAAFEQPTTGDTTPDDTTVEGEKR